MRKVRSSRSSDVAGAALLVALLAVLLVASAAPATAVTADAVDVPDEAAVGSQTTATVVVADLFRDPNLEAWTLSGETALTSVTWTVTRYDQAGNRLGQEVYDGQTFTHEGVTLDSGASEIEVKVTGTVPTIESYSYDPPQAFEAIALTQTRPQGSSMAIRNWSVHYFTEESRTARQGLDNASAAIAAARRDGADTTEAENTFDNAVAAFEGANFALATRLAGEARDQVGSARQSRQLLTLAVYAGVAVLLLVVLAAGYWYLQQRRRIDRLA